MYIVVEGEDPGFDIFVNGQALARHEDAVEKLAISLGVKPLIDFFSADENSMSLLIEEGAGNAELIKRLPPPQWYFGSEGLATIERLDRGFVLRAAQAGHGRPAGARGTERVRARAAKDGRTWPSMAPRGQLEVNA